MKNKVNNNVFIAIIIFIILVPVSIYTYFNISNVKSNKNENFSVLSNTNKVMKIEEMYSESKHGKFNIVDEKSINFAFPKQDNDSKFYILDATNLQPLKETIIKKGTVNIAFKDLDKDKRYRFGTFKEGKWNWVDTSIDYYQNINNKFVINNNGVELSFNQLKYNTRVEEKLIFNLINSIRMQNNVPSLKWSKLVHDLAIKRSADEVSDKAYHFHWTKSTGFANAALIKVLAPNEPCLYYKLCNIKISNRYVKINPRSNDFEQVTKGLMFGYQNTYALMLSHLHKVGILSNVVNTAIGLTSNVDLEKPQVEKIKIYGSLKDHNALDASKNYIYGNILNGIIDNNRMDINEKKLLNVSLSLYLF